MDTETNAGGAQTILVTRAHRRIAFICRGLFPCLLIGAAFAQQPTSFESLLASAQQAQARGDFDAAAGFYQQASRLRPEVAELKANLGLMYYQANKNEQAAEVFRQALRQSPGLFVPNLFLGLDEVKQEHFAEAVAYLKRAVQARPGDYHAQEGLAEAYSGRGDTRLAIHSYGRAKEIEPSNADVWYRLGVAYLNQVEADARTLLTKHKDSAYLRVLIADNYAARRAFIQAAEAYKNAIGLQGLPLETHANYGFVLVNQHDFTNAEHELRSELAVNPGSLLAKLGLARSQVEQGSIQEGAERIAEIWNADPGFLASNLPRFKAGMTQEKRSELQQALEALKVSGRLSEQAVSLFQATAADEPVASGSPAQVAPSSTLKSSGASAAELFSRGSYRQCTDLLVARLPGLPAKELRLLADCAYLTGDDEHTFEAAEKLAAISATEPEGLYWEIKSAQKLAAAALAHAGAMDSSSPKLHILLGDIYRQQKRLADAEEEYRKALTLRPEDTGAQFGLSLALLADGRIDEALQIAQIAVKANPSDPELNAVMGEILCKRNDFSEAEIHLKKALNTKPQYVSHVHALLGKVYANTDRPQEAIAEFKLALPDDKDGHLHYQIGRLYVRLGDRDSARRAFVVSQRLEAEALQRPVGDPDQGQSDDDSQ